MKKHMVGYCFICGKETKHEVIECKDSAGWRIFETVITAGLSLALPHQYKCECLRCGEINTLSK